MTRTEFDALDGMAQGQAILARQHRMTVRWARSFRREQGAYHRAVWTRDAFRLWARAEETLDLPLTVSKAYLE